jgi:hypothetical protein
MEFSVFRDLGLLEEDGFGGVEARGQEIDGDLDGVFSDGGRVGIVAGEGVPVGDEIQAVVGGIVLETDPVLERAEVVADVEASGGAHTGENSFDSVGQEDVLGWIVRFRWYKTVFSDQTSAIRKQEDDIVPGC